MAAAARNAPRRPALGLWLRVPAWHSKAATWRRPLRFSVCSRALGLTLALGASGAQAQTVITTQPAPAVVTTAAATVVHPAETTRTTRTVRTVRTFVPVKRQIITTRTVTRRIMP